MKKFIVIFLTLDLFLVDQLVKWWVIKYYPSLVFENRGIIFGFIKNPVIMYSLICVGIIILLWVIIKEKKQLFSFWHILPVMLISAGALSNIFDRIYRGYVVDYFNFYNLNNFNLADVFIVVGVLLYSYQVFAKK